MVTSRVSGISSSSSRSGGRGLSPVTRVSSESADAATAVVGISRYGENSRYLCATCSLPVRSRNISSDSCCRWWHGTEACTALHCQCLSLT